MDLQQKGHPGIQHAQNYKSRLLGLSQPMGLLEFQHEAAWMICGS